jgi:uncharacterized protein
VREFSAYGGFPEIVLEKNAVLKGKILREYFESLVYRDLAERHSLENTLALRDLLRFLSTNASSLFSANAYHKAVKQNVPVSRETIADYLAFIQDTGYFTLLPKFSYSLKEQVVNQKKVVALDNGLKNIATFRFSKDEGKNAENLVGSLLARKEESLYYWNGKQEVDFVWQQGRKLNAVNVTYGNTIEEREHTSLLEFKNAFRGVERLTLVTKDTEEKRGAIQLIPLWKWLLEI